MKKVLLSLILMGLLSFGSFCQTELFSDNFESYSTTQKLVEQSSATEWTTWSGTAGGADDASITTEQAYEGTKSVKIVSDNDLVLDLGGKTTGRYQIKFRLFISTGKSCFIGFLQDFAGDDSEFGATLYFKLNGGELNVEGKTINFDYNDNQWLLINTIVDLDDDYATIYMNGNLIASWIWSEGEEGESTISELDGVDFWGYDAAGTTCQYYIDDLVYNQLGVYHAPVNLTLSLTDDDVTLNWDAPSSGSPSAYKVFRNDILIASTSNLTYDDLKVYPGTYVYSVRADYGEYGMSTSSNEENITISGGVERNYVLFEVASGTWCSNCPGTAMGIHDLLSHNLDVAVVEYHEDDDYEFTQGVARIDFYDMMYIPTTEVDGVLEHVGGSLNTSLYDVYKPLYDQRIDILSTHSIDLDITKVDDTNYQASITVTEEYEYFSDNLVLITAVTESNIAESWHGQTDVDYTCRALYPDANGTALDFSANNTQTITLDLVLDASWVVANCEFVAFVQHNTSKEITQTIKAKVDSSTTNISSIKENDFNLEVYPNPFNDMLHVSLNNLNYHKATIELYNLTGIVSKSINIENINKKKDVEIYTEDMPSGIYFVQIIINNQKTSKKIILLR